MTDPLRWGIVGTGMIARGFAHAIQHTPGSTAVAVASRQQMAQADATMAHATASPIAVAARPLGRNWWIPRMLGSRCRREDAG